MLRKHIVLLRAHYIIQQKFKNILGYVHVYILSCPKSSRHLSQVDRCLLEVGLALMVSGEILCAFHTCTIQQSVSAFTGRFFFLMFGGLPLPSQGSQAFSYKVCTIGGGGHHLPPL